MYRRKKEEGEERKRNRAGGMEEREGKNLSLQQYMLANGNNSK